MWAWCYQRHRVLCLLLDAVLHLSTNPEPPWCLHHSHIPVIREPLSQLAAPGSTERGGWLLTQDGVSCWRLSTSNVSQKYESDIRGWGATKTPSEEFTHGWTASRGRDVMWDLFLIYGFSQRQVYSFIISADFSWVNDCRFSWFDIV